MPPGYRLTRSHITTTPDNTTQLRPSPAPKAVPSPNVNVLVDILPSSATSSHLSVGYTDGKVENMQFENMAPISGAVKSKYPLVQRKQEEVISIAKLVERVDAHARTLKAKDEGIS
ncbi:hypothetical protein QFC21_001894 [Naganishia friedmannii]|uniref:Uncharacterized protein n=1 Tax=Naganishia friedmannii TaxID=89922 RepID=A0ACC2W262_9TREE|nr:hypothetical protein QFC21_001894 [Naganishia friedmannii]